MVEGRDTQAIAQLTGRIQTLTIARVGFCLSREAREKVEGEVAAQAIARFRARAEPMSQQFGFGGYTVREVKCRRRARGHAGADDARAGRARAVADEPLPVEAGKATVTATVSGSVQMKQVGVRRVLGATGAGGGLLRGPAAVHGPGLAHDVVAAGEHRNTPARPVARAS